MHVRTQAVVNERVDYKTLHAEMIAVLESQVGVMRRMLCCACYARSDDCSAGQPACLLLTCASAAAGLSCCQALQLLLYVSRCAGQEEHTAGGEPDGKGCAAGGSTVSAAGKHSSKICKHELQAC
jgi:hypothetical protein